MANVTLAIEDDILKKARKLAVERNTTVTALIRETLKQLAARDEIRTEELIAELRESFDAEEMKVGPESWTRESLYDR